MEAILIRRLVVDVDETVTTSALMGRRVIRDGLKGIDPRATRGFGSGAHAIMMHSFVRLIWVIYRIA